MEYLSEHQLLLFLIQFSLILTLSKAIGSLFTRIKQPTITGDLLIGLILGPTILGRLFPNVFSYIFPQDIVQLTMLDTVAWMGILFFMLQAGMEINFESIWKQRRQAMVISISKIFLPMVVVFVAVLGLSDRFVPDDKDNILFSLFLASIMTISALPITIRVLHDLKILKTDLGVLIVSALTINDVLGWVIFSVILGIFVQAELNFMFVVYILSFTIMFTIVALTFLKNTSNKIIEWIHKKQENPSSAIVTYICLVGILFGAITIQIGIHSLFGFFLAGIMIGQSKLIKEKDRVFFENFVHSIFVPIFFVNIGLKLDFLSNFDIFLVAFITLVGFASRFAGAWTGSIMSKINRTDAMALGIAHTPGGEMHIVVGILALESGLISETIFIAIVLGAIISSIAVGPMLSFTYHLKSKHDIKNIFVLKNIRLGTRFQTREECFEFLCHQVSKMLGFDYETLLREVSNRETVLSTAVGHELALPHARLDNLEKPLIFFLRNSIGIEWDSPDGLLVKNIFLVITSTAENTQQLQIMADIATLCSDESSYQIISSSEDKNEILETIKSRVDNLLM